MNRGFALTVIVYKDGFIAADRSCSLDGKHLYEVCKIVRGRSTIGAASGSVIAVKSFNEWVEHDMSIPISCDDPDTFLGIAFDKDNVFLVTKDGFVSVPSDCAHATGLGHEIALGASDMGASADVAALVAARRMGCDYLGIDVCSLDTPITRIYTPRPPK